MSGLYLRDEYGNKIPLPAIKGDKGDQGEQGVVGDKGDKGDRGDGLFIRYSSFADGSEFTEKWTDGQDYIGIAHGDAAPVDKGGYEWSKFGSSELVDEVSNNAKRITNLEQGIPPSLFLTDSYVSHVKNVPTDARLFARVDSFGGLCHQSVNRISYDFDGTEIGGRLSCTINGDGSLFCDVNTVELEGKVVLSNDISPNLVVGQKYMIDCSGALSNRFYVALVSNGGRTILSVGSSFTFNGNVAVEVYYEIRTETIAGNAGNSYPMVYPSYFNPTNFFAWEGDDLEPTKVSSIRSQDMVIDVPTEVQEIDGYGVGIDDQVRNYIRCDLGDGVIPYSVVFVKMCEERDYIEGDKQLLNYMITNGTKTVAKLEAPIETDITDLFVFDGFIKVVAGGTIEFVNENSRGDVSSTVVYQLKEEQA